MADYSNFLCFGSSSSCSNYFPHSCCWYLKLQAGFSSFTHFYRFGMIKGWRNGEACCRFSFLLSVITPDFLLLSLTRLWLEGTRIAPSLSLFRTASEMKMRKKFQSLSLLFFCSSQSIITKWLITQSFISRWLLIPKLSTQSCFK